MPVKRSLRKGEGDSNILPAPSGKLGSPSACPEVGHACPGLSGSLICRSLAYVRRCNHSRRVCSKVFSIILMNYFAKVLYKIDDKLGKVCFLGTICEQFAHSFEI